MQSPYLNDLVFNFVMQVWLLPGVERAGRFYWGCTGSNGTLWAAASSELGLDSYLLWCTQTEMGTFNKTKVIICFNCKTKREDYGFCSKCDSSVSFMCPFNTLSLLNLGTHRDYVSHWDRRSHHGVLVSHQPHCNSADGTLPGLAVPRHLSQLLHMERQPWEKGRVGNRSFVLWNKLLKNRINQQSLIKDQSLSENILNVTRVLLWSG